MADCSNTLLCSLALENLLEVTVPHVPHVPHASSERVADGDLFPAAAAVAWQTPARGVRASIINLSQHARSLSTRRPSPRRDLG